MTKKVAISRLLYICNHYNSQLSDFLLFFFEGLPGADAAGRAGEVRLNDQLLLGAGKDGDFCLIQIRTAVDPDEDLATKWILDDHSHSVTSKRIVIERAVFENGGTLFDDLRCVWREEEKE
jgi:hypothetical protein